MEVRSLFTDWTEARCMFLFCLVFVWCGIGNRCGVVIGEGRRLELTFLCVFSLSCCFSGGGVLWNFFGLFLSLHLPKNKKDVVTKKHA